MSQAREQPIPGEFLYWRNKDRPWAKALRRVGSSVLGFDLAPDDQVVRSIAAMYFDADPVAEDFVDEVYLRRSTHEGRELLERALAQGVDEVPAAPASLHRLFDDIEHDPEWVTWDLVEEGARVFRRFRHHVFRFAGAITLAGYSENSVAKPLALTGAYQGGSTRHRFLETVAFWIAVSEPGGLRPGKSGRASALRVRIMHVFVRRRLLKHPEWDLTAWGVPISQGDALLTLMGGSVAPGLGLRAMGFRVREDEILALMHFWRYVGHLMGVRPSWYPSSMREAYQLAFVTALKGANRAGRDEQSLCSSYATAFAKSGERGLARVRAALEHRVHLGYTRLFTPPWVYRRNRLPPAGLWALKPLAHFPAIFAAETLRRFSPRFDDFVDRRARRARNRWHRRHAGASKAEYEPAKSFTR